MRNSFLFISLLLFAQAAFTSEKLAVAVFAGGCFWCMEPPYDKLEGVLSTTSGYIGGTAQNANYKVVSSGRSQHVEAVEIRYDASKVSYQELLDVFWQNVDPFDPYGQFCDKGGQYKSYIYFSNEQEKSLAQASLAKVKAKFANKVTTQIAEAKTFYPAEDYHQDYYQKNPIRYKFYRSRCGRDDRLEEVWGEQ